MKRPRRVLTLTGALAVLAVWAAALSLLIQPTAPDAVAEMPTLMQLPSTVPQETASANPKTTALPTHTQPAADVPAAAIDSPAEAPRESVPNRVLIRFDASASRQQREDYLNMTGGRVSQQIDALNTVVVDLPPQAVLPPSPLVAASEPDYYVTAQIDAPTSDPNYSAQWALPVIKAPEAWRSLPARTILVAVIDSGICADHPDLAGRIAAGWDFVENDAVPQDAFGHGCSVAGIIAANTDNGIGIAGVAPNARVMPLRVLDAQGVGMYSNVAAAIVKAVEAGARIINLSLGGYDSSDVLENAVNYAASRGVLVIAAAGNTGTQTVLYPAAYGPAVAVGSVDQNLQRSSFSSYGPAVDVWAPGRGILTTAKNNGYRSTSGTSFAAPHAAGVAALEMAFGQSLRLGGIVAFSGAPLPTATPTSTATSTPDPAGTHPVTGRPLPPENNAPITAVVTDEWAVRLLPGSDPDAVAAQLGFENRGQIGALADTYLFRQAGRGSSAQAAAEALDAAAPVVWFEQQLARKLYPQAPGDPLYPNQWHLRNVGQTGGTPGQDANLEPAWNAGYNGAGVQIAIVDDGLQRTHPDLSANYSPGTSYDFVDHDSDPLPGSAFDSHGTSVGGVAGARDNTTCGVGSAYRANLSGIRLLGSGVGDADIASALNYQYQLNAIYNSSWGPGNTGYDIAAPGTVVMNALQEGVTNGRGGLGNIYVFAAGNYKEYLGNINANGYANSRYVIAVGAVDHSGRQSYYSEPGAPMLVTAPSSGTGVSITTTDLMGSSGYGGYLTYPDCTNGFGGTSSSAPLVSGIIALMLQANPNLTWRDVQHILVNTAVKNDPADADWTTNGAGFHVNHKYGFGRVDAAAAVTLAAAWANVEPEVSFFSSTQTVNAPIPDGLDYGVPGAPVSDSINVMSDILVEHVEVVFTATHSFRSDLDVTLVSPSGTRSKLIAFRPNDIGANYTGWTFTSVRHWGESSQGSWTLEVRDAWNVGTGTFNSWQLKIYGMPLPAPPNDAIGAPYNIGALPYTRAQNTRFATSAVNDPLPGCGLSSGKSVWYTYTAAASEDILFSTTESNYDTALSVWTGAPGSLTPAACDDNGSFGSASYVRLSVTAGTTYYVMVTGNMSAGGKLVFHAARPPASSGSGCPVPQPYTVRASVDSSGLQAGQGTAPPGTGAPISSGGRYVAFLSPSTNLVSGDTNNVTDVFVRDLQLCQTARVSLNNSGAQANAGSLNAAVSGDGRFVVFNSTASNLVDADSNGANYDVFVYDRQISQISRVSVGPNHAQANGPSYFPAISANGRYVAFSSEATNLVPGDTNNQADIFVYDLETGQLTRESVSTGGLPSNGVSRYPALSADGRFLAFSSEGSNLVSGDTNSRPDVFVRDRQTGQTTRISVSSGGAQGTGGSDTPAISADGRYIAYRSSASNLVPGDVGMDDIFVYDRQTGQTTRVSVGLGGSQANGNSANPAISADGRYVTFSSRAGNLVINDTNDREDIFIHDRQTGQTARVSIPNGGGQPGGDSYPPAISADGRYVAYVSNAANVVTGDTNNAADVFVVDAFRYYPFSAPPNDNVNAAVVITALPFVEDTHNTGTVPSASDPVPGCGLNVGSTLWYTYTAATSEEVRLSTIGSDFNTVLSVWTGGPGSFVPVACDDDSGAAGTSALVFTTVPATTYTIMIGGYNDAIGSLHFEMYRPAPNDHFAMPLLIPFGPPYTDMRHTFGTTVEQDEPAPSCGVNAGHTLWYTFTPTEDANLWIDTNGSDFDTVLSVWTGTALNNLQEAACDNDRGIGLNSALQFPAASGVPYYIMVSGNQNKVGSLKLSLAPVVSPTPTPIPTDTPLPTSAPPHTTSRIGLFRLGVWEMSSAIGGGELDLRFVFGPQENGWQPVVGDWDGDLNQVDTIGVYKDGQWWLRDTNAGGFADTRFIFGRQESGWLPIAGDWDGDGLDTVGLYKNGEFWLRNTNTDGPADVRFVFGPVESGWIPLAGDWDGDGLDTVGLYKNGEFWLRNANADGAADARFVSSMGGAGWLPVAGDWNADGIDTIGVYMSGVWRLRNSNDEGFADVVINFGSGESGWWPVAGRWESGLPLGAVMMDFAATPTHTATPTAILIPPTATATLEPPTLTWTPTGTATLAPPTETPTTVPPTETPTLEPTTPPTSETPVSPTETP